MNMRKILDYITDFFKWVFVGEEKDNEPKVEEKPLHKTVLEIEPDGSAKVDPKEEIQEEDISVEETEEAQEKEEEAIEDKDAVYEVAEEQEEVADETEPALPEEKPDDAIDDSEAVLEVAEEQEEEVEEANEPEIVDEKSPAHP